MKKEQLPGNGRSESRAENHKGALFVPEIYITGRCNQNCLFCSVSANKPGGRKEPALSEIKNRLDQFKKLSHKIRITGGEAAVRKDFLEIIKYAKSIGFETIAVESNGQKFSNLSFAEKTVQAGADDFFISFHGHNAKLYDSMTCSPGSFTRAKQGIINLGNLGQRVSINIVITARNYKYLPEVVRLLRDKLGQSSVTLSFPIMSGELMRHRNLVPKMTDAVPYIKKALQANSGKTKISVQHLPFCVLGEANKYNIWVKVQKKTVIDNPNFVITIEPKNAHDRKDKGCAGCRYDNICYGIREGYADFYGFGELKPVKGKKIDDFRIFFAERDSLLK